jgi:hypothetical protein
MLPDFANTSYLQRGSAQQQAVFDSLSRSKILYHLHDFKPVLCGTLPLDLYVEGKSDLDIVCEPSDLTQFSQHLAGVFKNYPDYTLWQRNYQDKPAVVCRFTCDGIPIEVFGQSVPVAEQPAYRHMVIEYKLLQVHGERLKQKIRQLKQAGMKTEPAFAAVFGLPGNAYEAMLKLEKDFNPESPPLFFETQFEK